MSEVEIKNLVQQLNEVVISTEFCDLNDTFNVCQKLRDALSITDICSNEEIIHNALQVCISSLEKCTRMVNELELFSKNETCHEIQTGSLKFILLPALLGYLTVRSQEKIYSPHTRLKSLETSEVYFKDFLIRCRNYEFSKKHLKNLDEYIEQYDEESNTKPNFSSVRDIKIAQFKEKKELEDKMKSFGTDVDNIPEDNKREYYIMLIEKWVLVCIDELDQVKSEKNLLKSMSNRKASAQNNIPEKKKEVKPLKPFILTKTEVQKKVFGLGYPSMPVLTIDDYYRQRFEKEIEGQKSQSKGKSLQETALSGQQLDKEAEDIEKEKLLDKDDPETLMKARNWDDWKDDNPRGAGNRWNKG